jgi:hypothetical protein
LLPGVFGSAAQPIIDARSGYWRASAGSAARTPSVKETVHA